jgi:hypothetical protein
MYEKHHYNTIAALAQVLARNGIGAWQVETDCLISLWHF